MMRLRVLPPVFLRFCLLWRLRLLLTILLWLLLFICGFSGGSSSGFYSALPCISALSLVWSYTGFVVFFIALFPRAAGSVFVSSSLCFFEVFFAPASVPPLLLYLAILGVSTAFCCLCLVRISVSLLDVVSLWDESGFVEVSLSFSLFLSLLRVVSCFGIPFFGPLFFSSPSRLRSSSDVIAFWDGSSFTWYAIWLWCLVPSCSGSFSLLVPVSLPFLSLFHGSVQRLRSSVSPVSPPLLLFGVCCSSSLLSSSFILPSLAFLVSFPPSPASGCCGAFPWVCDSFGSKVSLSDGVDRWAECLLFLLATSPSPLGVSSVFPGCPLGFILFHFCNYFSSFIFCLGWFSFFYLGEFSFLSSFLGSLLPFSTLSFTILPSSSVDGRGYLAAVLAHVVGYCLPSFGLLPCSWLSSVVYRGLGFTLVVPFCLRPFGFPAF